MNKLLVEFARFQNLFPNLGDFILLLLKSSAILLMAFGVASLLQGQSARARNWVWRCVLAGLLALALWQCFPGSQHLVTLQAQPTSFPSTTITADASIETQNPTGLAMPAGEPSRESLTVRVLLFTESLILPLWLGVAVLLVSIHLLRSFGSVLWLRKNASPLELPVEKDLAGMNLFLTPVLDTPLLTGLFRPSIYLPENAKDWTSGKRRCVLLHEKAHRTRGDLFWQLAGTCSCALWWWNPLAWMALSRLKSEAEQAADDLVILQEGIAEPYARHLVEIAAGFTRQAPAGIPMLGRSPLEQRIRAILNGTLLRNRIGAWSGSLLASLSCLIFFCLAIGIAIGEMDLTNKWGEIVHYQADPTNNKLLQGNFKKSGGKLDGWKGSLTSVSSPENAMIRLKAPEKEAAIETTLRCEPTWEWMTIMAKVRPADGNVFDEKQEATIRFTPVDMAGADTAPSTILTEKRREGYTNWTNWIRTIRIPAGSYAIKVRIALTPGKGGLDCQEIGMVPTRAEDELDHRLVDRFFDALKSSDKKAVLELLKQEPKLVRARGFSDNGTPLMLCAWNELPEMAQILVDHGAELNAVDYGAWRSTALMWCGWWGSAKTAEVLIKAGSDVKMRSINGVTCLSAAKAGKTSNMARKASPEAFDQTIALMAAAEGKP